MVVSLRVLHLLPLQFTKADKDIQLVPYMNMSDTKAATTSEIWKSMTAFPNYEVSNLGFIRNAATLRVRNPTKDRRVILCGDGKRQRFTVTSLIVAAFLPIDSEETKIIFKDGNRCNWAVTNLEYAGKAKTCTSCHDNKSDTVPFRYNKCVPCHARKHQEYLNSLRGFVNKLFIRPFYQPPQDWTMDASTPGCTHWLKTTSWRNTVSRTENAFILEYRWWFLAAQSGWWV